MLRFLFPVVFGSLSLPCVVHAFQQPSDDIDVQRYVFRIEVNDTTDIIRGEAEVTFACRNALTEISLDLIGTNNDGKGMHVTTVYDEKGTALKSRHTGDRLSVFFATQLPKDGSKKIRVVYEGVPADGLIISKNKFGDRTFFADNWPNRGRNWLPLIDHPADKAAVEFAVIAPPHYDVVANGVRIEESFLNNRQKLTHYRENVPIATKVMVIGIARFAVRRAGLVEHIPVESWVYPQNALEGFHDYAVAVDILDYFHTRIGQYPYGKLANVQSKTTFGGLENAGAIFYYENSVNGKGEREGLIAHEIAHQWFGNSATEKDWPHVWLSEGFATYFSLLYGESVHGDKSRQAKMSDDRNKVIAYYKKDPAAVVRSDQHDPMKLLNANSYQKGSWVLHMLRREIGDEKFWKGIRKYYQKFRDGNASTSDFQSTMEAASGRDLGWFFEQWIYRPGHPVITIDWTYNQTTSSLDIVVRQQPGGPPFRFPLEIAVSTQEAGEAEIRTLYINKESHVFTIPAGAKPIKIDPDPSVNLLFEWKMKE